MISGGTVALVRRALESLYVVLCGAAGMTATDKKHSSCLDNRIETRNRRVKVPSGQGLSVFVGSAPRI